MCSLYALFWFLRVLLTDAKQAKDPAWNGLTTSGSQMSAPFTPFYVPPGAKSYDLTSPLIAYKVKENKNNKVYTSGKVLSCN